MYDWSSQKEGLETGRRQSCREYRHAGEEVMQVPSCPAFRFALVDLDRGQHFLPLAVPPGLSAGDLGLRNDPLGFGAVAFAFLGRHLTRVRLTDSHGLSIPTVKS